MYEIHYSHTGVDQHYPVNPMRARSQDRLASRPVKSQLKFTRFLYEAGGYFFVGLAILGALLPVLPTTPFLILASGCFLRSNPAMRIWLLQLPGWGPALRDWENHRAVRPRTKLLAIGLMICAVALTIVLTRPSTTLLVILLLGAGTGALVVHGLPALDESRQSHEPKPRRVGKRHSQSRHLVGGK